MTSHHRRTVLMATATMVLTLTAACSSSGGGGGSSAGTDSSSPVDVTIGIASPVAAFALPQIAADNNLWPSNVKVSFSVIEPNTISSSVATGKIQFVLGASPRWEVIHAQSNVPISYLAQWGDPPDFQMIARPGINSVSDLKGKSIAIPAPSSSVDYLSQIALDQAGVSKGEYKLLSVGNAPQMVSTFISGTADAFVLPASSVQSVLGKVPGSKVVYDFYAQNFAFNSAALIAYDPWTKDHSAATVGVIKALSAALQMVHDDPAKAKPSVTKFIGATDPAVADSTFKYFAQRSPRTLQPVSSATERSVASDVRKADGTSVPSDASAVEMINNEFLK